MRRHRRLVIAAWIVVVGVSIPFARSSSERLTSGLSGVKGSQSNAVQSALDEGQFGAAGRPQMSVVIQPQQGAGPQAVEGAISEAQRAAKQTGDVVLSQESVAAARSQARSGTPVIMSLAVAEPLSKSVDPAQQFIERLDPGVQRGGTTTYVIGQPALQAEQSEESKSGTDAAATVSTAAMLILLLAIFGAILAAIIPLLLGFCAVAVTGMAIYLLAGSLSISIYATSLAAMIGLAVAVDYTLFILLRYREEIAGGATPQAASDRASGTSAVAVMFSGTTVIVSLAGLLLMPNATVRSMALGAIIVVAVALLGAASLLPALIALFGDSVARPGRIGRALSRVAAAWRRPGHTPLSQRLTTIVTARPAFTIAGVLLLLLVVAYPTVKINLDEAALKQLPADNQARVGTELAGQIAGEGSTSPTLVMLAFDSGTVEEPGNSQALGEVKSTLSAQPYVAKVAGPQPSTDKTSALFSVQLRYYAESAPAEEAVEELRGLMGRSPAASVSAISVGGLTATQIDFNDSISQSMWKIVVFILLASFLILLVLLRSLLLPIVGVAMNVLCVGAAYGVDVAIFQWGWLPFLGFQDYGFVDSVILPLLLAIVFGLSMDYQVFMLSRIREQGTSAKAAARAGAAAAAHTIVSAATIMVTVFLIFVIFGVPTIQAAGLGAAVAVATSALLVQLAFMPALIVLIGERAWWLPRWLDRALAHAPRHGGAAPDTLGGA